MNIPIFLSPIGSMTDRRKLPFPKQELWQRALCQGEHRRRGAPSNALSAGGDPLVMGPSWTRRFVAWDCRAGAVGAAGGQGSWGESCRGDTPLVWRRRDLAGGSY